MAVAEAQDVVSNIFRERTSNSSAYKFTDMKESFTNKLKDKAEGGGFDPKLVTTGACDLLTKVMAVVAVMREKVGTFSKQYLLKNSSWHGIFLGCGYSINS